MVKNIVLNLSELYHLLCLVQHFRACATKKSSRVRLLYPTSTQAGEVPHTTQWVDTRLSLGYHPSMEIQRTITILLPDDADLHAPLTAFQQVQHRLSPIC